MPLHNLPDRLTMVSVGERSSHLTVAQESAGSNPVGYPNGVIGVRVA